MAAPKKRTTRAKVADAEVAPTAVEPGDPAEGSEESLILDVQPGDEAGSTLPPDASEVPVTGDFVVIGEAPYYGVEPGGTLSVDETDQTPTLTQEQIDRGIAMNVIEPAGAGTQQAPEPPAEQEESA